MGLFPEGYLQAAHGSEVYEAAMIYQASDIDVGFYIAMKADLGGISSIPLNHKED